MDPMLDAALARAGRGGTDALAGLLLAYSLEARASLGSAREGFQALASRSGYALADEAAWLARRLEPTPPRPWLGLSPGDYEAAPESTGLVRAFALLGPFQDSSGEGLLRPEGPELPGQRFGDAQARYSWGVYDVHWRRALPALATARGLPLDLYVRPRSETCTYLASRVSLTQPGAALLHVASAGSVRVLWDGVTAAVAEEVQPGALFDRLALRVQVTPGEHLLGLKVCSSSTSDAGRVRVRFTDEARRPLEVRSASTFEGLTEAQLGGRGDEGARLSAGFARVTTPLELALAAGERPGASRTERLAAAFLRTEGGADNGRSPRAPGMLDGIASEPDVRPDELAMAAWVAPFETQRSGWFQKAEERGRHEGDPETVAFAQRRRGMLQLRHRMRDWARATLSSEPFASAQDPESWLLRDFLAEQDGGPGAQRVSADRLAALIASPQSRASLSIWREVADGASILRAPALEATRRLPELAPLARTPRWVRQWRALGADALEKAVGEALPEQSSADDVVTLGELLLELGRWEKARDVFSYAREIAPNLAAAHQGWAKVQSVLLAKGGGTDLVRSSELEAALRRASELSPENASLKAELHLRAGDVPKLGPGGRSTSGARDEQWIVEPAVFLERMRKAGPLPAGVAVDRQLHWSRVVTYHEDRRISQLMHYAREIIVEPRTEGELVEGQLPSEGDRTELLFARVHRKDGSVVAPAEQSTGDSMGSAFVRWPELRTGDVVEVAVRSWTSGPVGRRGDAPFYFIDYVGSVDTHPILFNEVVVDSPAHAPLAVDVLNGKAEKVESIDLPGRKVTRYVWESPPNLPEEPLAPELSESLPVVVGSTYSSWEAFRAWYRAAVQGFTEPDDQVRRLAAELTKGKETREEKLRALFEFVSDDIRYVNYVSGEWWLPNRPQELLARRQGDCDDKAMLLITLLRAVGIEATEVLVQTRYAGKPSLLESSKAAIPVFDHGIAFLPGRDGGPGLWLDATSPESRLGPLPSMDARARAMFVDEGPAVILPTPPSSPAEHGTDATWTLRLSDSGAGELEAFERQTGDAAFRLRGSLKQADARQQWVEQNVAHGWFPTIQVQAGVEFRSELPLGATELRYKARSEGLARREGDELTLSLSEVTTLTSELAPLVRRTLPVVLPPELAPGHHAVAATVHAPSGYVLADLPPGGDADGGSFGRASLTFERVGGTRDKVVIKRSLTLDQSTIPVSDYPRWRAWLQKVDGLMHRSVRFVPKGRR